MEKDAGKATSAAEAAMDSPTFPVTGSLPCVAALVKEILVRAYGLSSATTCRFHNFGLNDTFIVESDSAKFALRVYRAGWRSAADIGYELDVLEHLAGKGVSVAAPVRRRDGDPVTTLVLPEGKRSAVLFHFAPGQGLKDDEVDSAAFGHSCAQMHDASDHFVSNHQRFELDLRHLLEEPLALIRPHLAHRAKDWEFVQRTVERLQKGMENLEQSRLDRGFCHGDFHGGNVHREEEKLTHFDFDCCGAGWRAYDIAVFRWACRLGNQDPQSHRWRAYLAGYRQVRTLSATDMAAVELFVPIRQIWLMGMHLHGGPRWGFGWLGERYFDQHINQLREMMRDHVEELPLFSGRSECG